MSITEKILCSKSHEFLLDNEITLLQSDLQITQ